MHSPPRSVQSVEVFEDRVVIHDVNTVNPTLVEANNGVVHLASDWCLTSGKAYRQWVLKTKSTRMFVDMHLRRVSRFIVDGDTWVFSDGSPTGFVGDAKAKPLSPSRFAWMRRQYDAFDGLTTFAKHCLQTIWLLIDRGRPVYQEHLRSMRDLVFPEFEQMGDWTGSDCMPVTNALAKVVLTWLAASLADRAAIFPSKRGGFLSVFFGWMALEAVIADGGHRGEDAYFESFTRGFTEILHLLEREFTCKFEVSPDDDFVHDIGQARELALANVSFRGDSAPSEAATSCFLPKICASGVVPMLPRQLDSVDFHDDRVVLHDSAWAHPIEEANNGLVQYEPGKFYKQCVLELNGLELYVDFLQFRVTRAVVHGEPWVLSYPHDQSGVSFLGREGKIGMPNRAMEGKILHYALDYMGLPGHVLKCLESIWFLLSEERAHFKFHLATIRKVLFEDAFHGIGLPTGLVQSCPMPFDALQKRLDATLAASKLDDVVSRRDMFLSVVFGWTMLDLVLADARERGDEHQWYYASFVRDFSDHLRRWEKRLALSPQKGGRQLFGIHWLVEQVQGFALDQAKACLGDHDKKSFDFMLDELGADEADHSARQSKRSARRRREKEHRRDSKDAHARSAAAKRAADQAAAEQRAEEEASAAVERAMEIAYAMAANDDRAGAAKRLGESLKKHHARCRKDVRERAAKKRAEWTRRAPPDDDLICPILLEEMRDPVVLAGDGKTYERSAIEAWLSKSRISPLLGLELNDVSLSPNECIRAATLARRSPN